MDPIEEARLRIEAWRRPYPLNLSGIAITSLPDIPGDVTDLILSNTRLSHLPKLSTRVRYLFIDSTNISQLDDLPPYLIELNASNTPLSHIAKLPPYISLLNISNTPLTSLPYLPYSLTSLDITGCKMLTNLPDLTGGDLAHLYADGSGLIKLISIPFKLQTLVVSNTNMLKLPPLNYNLRVLEIANTLISTIPNVPACLERFYCMNCPIEKLPSFIPATSLTVISLQGCPVKELPLILMPKLMNISRTQIQEISESLFESYCDIYASGCPFFLQRRRDEPVFEYNMRMAEHQRCMKTVRRTRFYKEELIAFALRPARISRLIDEYGMDVLEHI
jgi:E3 ubiquitin-protein ligase SspH2